MSMKHNTVYPKRYIVVHGDIIRGFILHGTFVTHDRAWSWALDNMHVGSEFKVIEMFDVRDEE